MTLENRFSQEEVVNDSTYLEDIVSILVCCKKMGIRYKDRTAFIVMYFEHLEQGDSPKEAIGKINSYLLSLSYHK